MTERTEDVLVDVLNVTAELRARTGYLRRFEASLAQENPPDWLEESWPLLQDVAALRRRRAELLRKLEALRKGAPIRPDAGDPLPVP